MQEWECEGVLEGQFEGVVRECEGEVGECEFVVVRECECVVVRG